VGNGFKPAEPRRIGIDVQSSTTLVDGLDHLGQAHTFLEDDKEPLDDVGERFRSTRCAVDGVGRRLD